MSLNNQTAAHQQHKTLHKPQSFVLSPGTYSENVSQQMANDDIAQLAGRAFAAARNAAIAAGCSVMEARGDRLVEVSPDGSERIVKRIAGPTKTAVGAKYLI